MTEINIAAVGDILMIGPILSSSKLRGRDGYNFDPIFEKAIPYLKNNDLVIGNLETPLAGAEAQYARKNKRTGFTMFNSPDELAAALKGAGFHLLTTANNHCLDRGEAGLARTLRVLKKHGLEHTGTYASPPGNENHWIQEVKGIRIGVVSYTKGTNRIPLPGNKPWMVNTFDQQHPVKLIEHVRRLRSLVDVVIVCVHFGKECRPYPTLSQKRVVQLLLRNGAHIVLGCHPHVLQPTLKQGGKFAVYSLGNFVSTRLYNNTNTNCGMILRLTVAKKADKQAEIKNVSIVPTWTLRTKAKDGSEYRIIPILDTLKNPYAQQTSKNRILMRQIWKLTSRRVFAKK